MTDVTQDRDQAGAELSVADEQVLRELTDPARARHETHKTRETAHFSTIPACDARTLERHGSPVH
jgi:hypothetical protein